MAKHAIANFGNIRFDFREFQPGNLASEGTCNELIMSASVSERVVLMNLLSPRRHCVRGYLPMNLSCSLL